MNKGQGSFETILIIAAVLIIAVSVVLTANYLLGEPTEQTSVIDDKFAASLKGAELIGYEKPFDGDPANAPDGIVVNREDSYGVNVVGWDEIPDDAEYLTSLSGEDGTYPVFVSGGGGGGSAYIPITSAEADDDGDGIPNSDEDPDCITNPDPECGVISVFADLSVDTLTVTNPMDNSVTFDTIPLGANVELRTTLSNIGDDDAGSFTVNFYKVKNSIAPKPLPITPIVMPGPTATIPPGGSKMTMNSAMYPTTPSTSTCPPTYNPICTIGYKTYTNFCYALKDKVKIGYFGDCYPISDKTLIGTVTVNGLPAGDSTVVSVPFTAATAGSFNFEIIVDPDYEVIEEVTANNMKSFPYTVAEQPTDLYLESDHISFSANPVENNDILTVTAAIHNSGNAATGVVANFFEMEYNEISPPVIPPTALLTLPITGYVASGGDCPAVYEPVCGDDDQTYGNACNAGQVGADMVYDGACVSGLHYIGTDTVDLETGGLTEASVDWNATGIGLHKFVVLVDPFGEVDEVTADNNDATSGDTVEVTSTKISPGPTLTPTPTPTIPPQLPGQES